LRTRFEVGNWLGEGAGMEDQNEESRVPEREAAAGVAKDLLGKLSTAAITAHDQGFGADPADARRRPVAPDEVLGRNYDLV
jgi:hypothetical protein